mgnify:FL=1
MDSLTLLSWNVQGLGGDKFHKVKGLFNQELSSQYVGKFDILLIQEHHLSQNRVAKIRKFLKGRWFYDWILANGPTRMQGGLAIACSEKWASLIVDKGFLQGGRAQCIVLKLLEKKVGFLNDFAPNSTMGRAQFWCQ